MLDTSADDSIGRTVSLLMQAQLAEVVSMPETWAHATSAIAGTSHRLLNVCSRLEICQCSTIFVILLVLWLLGWLGFHALGAYIHIVLVLALIVLVIQLFSGRRTV